MSAHHNGKTFSRTNWQVRTQHETILELRRHCKSSERDLIIHKAVVFIQLIMKWPTDDSKPGVFGPACSDKIAKRLAWHFTPLTLYGLFFNHLLTMNLRNYASNPYRVSSKK